MKRKEHSRRCSSFVPVDPKKRTSKVFEFFDIHEASHLLDKDVAESERSCCSHY